MLALRLLWRSRSCTEIPILLLALTLAVMLVTAVQVFSARLDAALVGQSSQFLGADRLIRSPQPMPSTWALQASEAGVRTAEVIEFASMVFAGDAMQLAAVKAVTANYPLRGKLQVAEQAFAPVADWQVTTVVPAAGDAWVDSRLLPLLGIGVGDSVMVGEQPLRVTRILMEEPDRGDSLSLLGVRLLMNADDLAATGVIQPGSRVDYQWLLAGQERDINQLLQELSPQPGENDRILDVASAQRGLGRALSTASQFLLLTGMMGVLLAGVALAIAARRFAQRQVPQVALLKALGQSATAVRRLYLMQLGLMAVAGISLGLLAGEAVQQLAVALLSGDSGFLGEAGAGTTGAGALWPSAQPEDYLGGLATGWVCLFGFCIPSLWHLPAVAPVTVFRGGSQTEGMAQLGRLALGGLALLVLIALLSGDIYLTLSFGAGLVVLIVLAWGLVLALLALVSRVAGAHGYLWRVASASLQRYPARTLTQILAFAVVIMMGLTLAGVRNGLLDDWQTHFAPGTPNYFVMNIADSERAEVQRFLDDSQVQHSPFYPMVRGRIVAIKGEPITDELYQKVNALQRELNLSWAASLPSDNQLVAGHWWSATDLVDSPKAVLASVEQSLAAQLELGVGDSVELSIGGETLRVTVASIRSLRWDSMQPNFYVLLNPGVLDHFAPAWLASLYLPEAQRQNLNDILRQFPTLVVIEMEKILAQVRAMVAQVTSGLSFMVALILPGALLVLAAVVYSSLDERRQEASLLRALGGRRWQILGAIVAEFSVCGVLAGVLAVIGSELVLLGLQHWVLKIPLQLHALLWAIGPLAGALCVALLGLAGCYSVIRVSPLQVLRQTG